MKEQKYINKFIELVRSYQHNKQNRRVQTETNRQAQFNKISNLIQSTFYPHHSTVTNPRNNTQPHTHLPSKHPHLHSPPSLTLYLQSQAQPPIKKKRKYQVYQQIIQQRNSTNKEEFIHRQSLKIKAQEHHEIIIQKTLLSPYHQNKEGKQDKIRDDGRDNKYRQTHRQTQSNQRLLIKKDKKDNRHLTHTNQFITAPEKQNKKWIFSSKKNLLSLDGTSINFNKIKPFFQTNQTLYKELFKIQHMENSQKPYSHLLKSIQPFKQKHNLAEDHGPFLESQLKSKYRYCKRQTTRDRFDVKLGLLESKMIPLKTKRQRRNGLQDRISGWQND